MTKIDFYVLQQDSIIARLHYACRLTEKALSRQHRVVLAVDNEQTANELSDYLWQFKPESFLPHQLENSTIDAPIRVCWSLDDEQHHDILINLKTEIPAWFSRFQRVLEVVVQHEQCLSDTREHFLFYRDRGYPLQSHNITP